VPHVGENTSVFTGVPYTAEMTRYDRDGRRHWHVLAREWVCDSASTTYIRLFHEWNTRHCTGLLINWGRPRTICKEKEADWSYWS